MFDAIMLLLRIQLISVRDHSHCCNWSGDSGSGGGRLSDSGNDRSGGRSSSGLGLGQRVVTLLLILLLDDSLWCAKGLLFSLEIVNQAEHTHLPCTSLWKAFLTSGSLIFNWAAQNFTVDTPLSNLSSSIQRSPLTQCDQTYMNCFTFLNTTSSSFSLSRSGCLFSAASARSDRPTAWEGVTCTLLSSLAREEPL